MITQEHFKLLAAYNRWANARLYAAALTLSELSYRLHTGVYFGSLHGTLNHLLLTDRLWLKRLTGEGDLPNDLNAILYEDRIELTKARIAEDNRMVEVTGKYDETALRGLHSYRTTSGMPQSQVLADILLHLFNHQTHHRGQAHACLSILTGGEPPPLDLLAFQKRRRNAKPRKINGQQVSGRRPSQFLEGSLRRSKWCSNPGIEITGAIHRLQLPASQKDHAWTQTAAISDPMPDLRWVHRIKHPGCSRVRNGSSVGSEIPRCVESEVSVSSYTDFFVRDRA